MEDTVLIFNKKKRHLHSVQAFCIMLMSMKQQVARSSLHTDLQEVVYQIVQSKHISNLSDKCLTIKSGDNVGAADTHMLFSLAISEYRGHLPGS